MTQQSKPTKPFAGSLAASSAQANAAPSTPPPATAPAARPLSSARSPFGTPRVNWQIIPVFQHLVRFELNGLGDPFYRVLAKPVSLQMGDPKAVLQALQAGGEDVAELTQRLNSAWQDYNLRGAVLMYTWREEIRQRGTAKTSQPSSDGDDSDDMDDIFEDIKHAPVTVLRSLDVLLTLNLLCRTRSNILLPTAALALEGQYLKQSLMTDDPRIVALARATGSIEEVVIR
jgi:hypothetical protein